MFVKFNEALGDWQIQPSDRDLPFSGNLAYFSRKENSLYSFGNFIYNQSMSEEKKFLDSLYRIDLLTMKWENLGKLNETLINKYHLHYRSNTLSNNTGCFILPTSADSTALFLDFETKKYSAYNSKNNSRLFRFFRELPANQQLYSDSYGLKILSNDSIVILDSISWEAAIAQPVESLNLIDGKTPTIAFKYSLLLGGIGLVFGILVLFYLYKRKKSKSVAISVPPVMSFSRTLDLSISNTIVFQGAMYPIDTADYFVIQKLAQQDATTIDLNDWLGLENKQPENQKKQRAEWIKRMNTFFQSIGFNDDAFKRDRLETDKRMFVYKMNFTLKQNGNSELPLSEK